MPAILEVPTRHGVRTNAKTWANKFEARFLEAGLVNYDDCGCGMNYLSHETIARCAQSFVGRPVIIKHKMVTPETMEPHAQGFISDVWFNEADGWWWCSGTIHGDEAKELIKKGHSVSCSYKVTNTASGGSYHNANYDEEISDFEGMHLAIVDNPRYERAIVRLNSKQSKRMFKFLKSLLGGETKDNAAAPEAEEVSGESQIEVGEKLVTISELVDRYNAAPADSVDIEGKQVPISELVATYKGHQAEEKVKAEALRSNESEEKKDEETKDNESEEKSEEEETKDNESEKEEEKEEVKDNAVKKADESKHFDILNAARDNAAFENTATSVDTLEDRMERARVRYSLKRS